MHVVARPKDIHFFDALFSVKEACEIMSIKRSKLYTMLGRGDISAVKIGCSTRIYSSEIDRFLSEAKPAAFRKPATVH